MKSSKLVLIATVLIATVLVLASCGGSSSGTDSGSGITDSGGGNDAAVEVDSAAEVDSGPVATHDCGDADFIDQTAGTADDRMIMVPRGTTTFDFPCMTIRAGQSVMFMWDFTMHPLAAGGVAPGHPGTGTTPSPIEARTSGVVYDVAFPSPGDYPFYCETHHHSGMVGVVRVVP